MCATFQLKKLHGLNHRLAVLLLPYDYLDSIERGIKQNAFCAKLEQSRLSRWA